MKKLLPIILLALSVNGYASAFDEVINPPTYTREQCAQINNAVWVESAWQSSGLFGASTQKAQGCILYYASKNVANAKTAIIFIHGDVYTGDKSKMAASYERRKKNMQRAVNKMAKATQMPVIHVMRPGCYGSSGMNHIYDRRMEIEAQLMNAALDEIKNKFSYQNILIAGQSGGGGLVGAVLTMGRTDIACAVSSSGAISIKTRAAHMGSSNARQGRDETGRGLNEIYDPIDHVSKITHDSKRRIFILGDPMDMTVAFASQKEFHERLLQKGYKSTLLTGEATDAHHHGLSTQGQKVAGWCHEGLSDEQIQANLNKLRSATADKEEVKDSSE